MKLIGLIGGMSWESSVHYYQAINEEIKERLGGLHSAKCLLYSVDFEEIERYQANGEWEKAGELLADVALKLEKAGVDFILLCTNTMHKVIDMIEAKITVPVIHIADATAQDINKAGLKKVGLLGTKYTMEQDFYISRIEQNGISVIVPNEEDRHTINRIIFEELCLGKIEPSSRQFYKKVIQDLIQQGAEGIILGCTEIGLLVRPEDSDVPLFDTAVIHAKEAVNKALK